MPPSLAELERRADERGTESEAQRATHGRELAFEDRKDGVTLGLLQRPGLDPWTSFTCLTSLRDVEADHRREVPRECERHRQADVAQPDDGETALAHAFGPSRASRSR